MIRRSLPPLPAIWPLLSPNDILEPSLTISPTMIHSCRSPLVLRDWRPRGCSTYCSDKQALPLWWRLCTFALFWRRAIKLGLSASRGDLKNLPHIPVPAEVLISSTHSTTLPVVKWDPTDVYTFTNCSCCVKSSVQNVNISGTAKSCLVFGFITVHFF